MFKLKPEKFTTGRCMKFIVSSLLFLASVHCGTLFAGDIAAGEKRYGQNCFVCHGPGGKGMASYPKLAGKEVAYLTERLNTYRAGTKIGPNSDLMIMNAQPLSDDEIANLAAYLSSLK